MLGDTQVHQAFGAIKLGARLQLIKRPIDDRCARGSAGRSIVGATQESPKASAPDRPGFAVAIDHKIRISRPGSSVEELGANRQQGELHGRTQEKPKR